MGVAGVTAPLARPGRRALAGCAVTHVVHERPGTIEGGGSEVIGVPAHGVASGVADRAVDALDRRVGRTAFGARRLNGGDRVGPRSGRHEGPLRALPLLEEGPHVA